MKIYRIAIIGLGGMGNNHTLAVQAEDNCQLVGGAEIDIERARSWKERFGVNAVFDSYEKMLDQLEPDILINATQSSLHCAPTLAAARRGIHVFCEKPPGRDLEDIARVIACEKNHPELKLKYGFNHRYHHSVRDALSTLKSGELGKVINLRGVYGKSQIVTFGKQSDWRTNRDLAGGGILLDQGIHMVDLLRLFSGDFVEVKSFISNGFWNHNVEDNAYEIGRASCRERV